MNHQLINISEKVAQVFKSKELTLAMAESCTGGLVAAALTELAGSSMFFERGFVTYSNAAKHENLGVSLDALENHCAVSAEVARAMAEGVIAHSQADYALAITGIAGPDGGSEAKPVGLVWFGFASRKQAPWTLQQIFAGDRSAIREQAAIYALQNLLNYLDSQNSNQTRARVNQI